MASFAALKKNPFKSEVFKDVQMSLFDFLKLNPLAKYKNKDLEGPLKYLKPQTPESSKAPETVTSEVFDESSLSKISATSLGEPTSGLDPLKSNDESLDSTILGFPTLIERQAYLRYIRFHLRPNGILKVTAPKNRSFEDIKNEILEYKDWVFKRHEEFEHIRKSSPPLKWRDGQSFPYLGQDYKLKLQPFESRRPMIQLDLDQLHYFYPVDWDLKSPKEKSILLKQYLLKFYKTKAVLELNKRTRLWSEKMGLFPKKLSFRNQKTRWGSCSSQGKISLNWRLVAYSPEVMDYIVIHELAHLKHQNHSARFWNLVGEFCPDYQKFRKHLRDQQYFADFLAPTSELYLENPILENLKPLYEEAQA